MPDKKTISILGCGWYGFALAEELIRRGYPVKGSTTSADKLQKFADAKIEPFLIDFTADKETYDDMFFNCDALIVSIPPKVRTGNSKDYLMRINRIINAIKLNKVKQVIFISSTSVYGDLNIEVNEKTTPNPDTASGKAMLNAECLFKQEITFITTIIRFAGLIGPGREPGRFFSGKTDIPNGMAPVNLIHLDDCIGLSCTILEKEAFGSTYNACAPSHPQKAEFYTQAAIRSGLAAPQFINELNNWKTVSCVNAETILNYKYEIGGLME